jgi:large subunit ribosomal protein L13
MKIIINAKDAIAGRVGSYAARELLKGNEVVVIHSNEAIISGNKQDILNKIRILRKKGGSSQKGPKFSKSPERILKRMIRGMLPWDRSKGREAFDRLRCYAETENLSEEDVKKAVKIEFKKPQKYISIKEIAKLL